MSEYDVEAEARSLTALQNELHRVILFHLCIAAEFARRPLESIPPAPQKFWDMFTSSNVRVNADIVPVRFRAAPTLPKSFFSCVSRKQRDHFPLAPTRPRFMQSPTGSS